MAATSCCRARARRTRRLVAIILTGMQTDGAQGVRDVKRRGGRVLVQDPATARASGMPSAALATGCVDFVLPAARIGARDRRAHHGSGRSRPADGADTTVGLRPRLTDAQLDRTVLAEAVRAVAAGEASLVPVNLFPASACCWLSSGITPT